MNLLARFRNLPIRRKLSVLMLVSSAVGLVFSAAPLIGYAWVATRSIATRDLDTVARIVADSTAAAVAFHDLRVASDTLGALRTTAETDSACLYTDDGSSTAPALFAKYVTGPESDCPPLPGAAGIQEELGHLTIVKPVEVAGDRVGWLRIRQNLHTLRTTLAAQIAITLAILGISFGISLSLALIMQSELSQPVLNLAELARRVSETRDFRLRAEKYSQDEVGHLTEDFNRMLEQIELRDQEIRGARDALTQEVQEKTRANLELEQILRRLQETQSQLVQSERLASLGALVAGIAHEINTPVGVGVTAASTLQDRANKVRQLYQESALKRTDLERFVALADESTRIILKNLQRAADLIHSFKQVAVDQSSGERRKFVLKTYLEEVLLSLAPKLKRAGHIVSVDCPQELTVDSYPGAIAQILTNLVSNSLMHAYDPGQIGHLTIKVSGRDDWVTLYYTDDGRGIPTDYIGRIYDPFFTTKRGSGGSGLGLHIVYNLVTQMLDGTIEARSEPGQGAEFMIGFPAVARRRAA